MDFNTALAGLLQSRQEELNLPEVALADKTGLARASIRRYLLNPETLRLRDLRRVLAALNLTFSDLDAFERRVKRAQKIAAEVAA